ncbi:nucleotidyltransferase domain-containing protein [Parabacteroides sp. AF48-14]|uniref:nucleotidyltransferase family protein n=1 Tax=Parabacteroides sp. AF48-14 TaxID=2292052 RepID=UPI000EFF366F|nr:nucleotidyltransferase domain-containing protein [Parabacteroides sp. AF48-14]RHO71896.1 nucleotidyltransferase domain-containing protein [Parabacteroides sp. AF48-14]
MRRTDVVEQIKKVVHEVAPTAKAILFGSEARGDARPDSDIDLLILMDGDKLSLESEEAVTLPLYELELKTGIAINPIVMLKKLWDNRPFKTPFYVNVVNEGVVL